MRYSKTSARYCSWVVASLDMSTAWELLGSTPVMKDFGVLVEEKLVTSRQYALAAL